MYPSTTEKMPGRKRTPGFNQKLTQSFSPSASWAMHPYWRQPRPPYCCSSTECWQLCRPMIPPRLARLGRPLPGNRRGRSCRTERQRTQRYPQHFVCTGKRKKNMQTEHRTNHTHTHTRAHDSNVQAVNHWSLTRLKYEVVGKTATWFIDLPAPLTPHFQIRPTGAQCLVHILINH